MEEVKDSKEEVKPKEEELIKLGPPVTCIKGEHSFQVIGMEFGMRQVQCTKCPIGYYLGLNDSLKDGHIYTDNKFVI